MGTATRLCLDQSATCQLILQTVASFHIVWKNDFDFVFTSQTNSFCTHRGSDLNPTFPTHPSPAPPKGGWSRVLGGLGRVNIHCQPGNFNYHRDISKHSHVRPPYADHLKGCLTMQVYLQRVGPPPTPLGQVEVQMHGAGCSPFTLWAYKCKCVWINK